MSEIQDLLKYNTLILHGNTLSLWRSVCHRGLGWIPGVKIGTNHRGGKCS